MFSDMSGWPLCYATHVKVCVSKWLPDFSGREQFFTMAGTSESGKEKKKRSGWFQALDLCFTNMAYWRGQCSFWRYCLFRVFLSTHYLASSGHCLGRGTDRFKNFSESSLAVSGSRHYCRNACRVVGDCSCLPWIFYASSHGGFDTCCFCCKSTGVYKAVVASSLV